MTRPHRLRSARRADALRSHRCDRLDVDRQTIDLAAKLPDYQANIEAKMRAFRMPRGGTFARFNQSSLCLLDVRPRKMTEHERRVLESFADDLSEEIQHRATGKEAAVLAARQSAPAATS